MPIIAQNDLFISEFTFIDPEDVLPGVCLPDEAQFLVFKGQNIKLSRLAVIIY